MNADTDSKHERITLRVTAGEKNQLKRHADLAGKPLSEYVRDMAFSTPLSAVERKVAEDLQQLKEKTLQQEADITYLKKSIYVMTKLLLPISLEQAMLRTLFPSSLEEKSPEKVKEKKAQEQKAQKKIMDFYEECAKKAEKKFNKE